MSAWIAGHRKVLIAIAGAVVTVAVQAGWTSNPWVSLIVLAATAAGVYQAPNAGPQPAPEGRAITDAGTVQAVPATEPQPVAERVRGGVIPVPPAATADQPPVISPGLPPSGVP